MTLYDDVSSFLQSVYRAFDAVLRLKICTIKIDDGDVFDAP